MENIPLKYWSYLQKGETIEHEGITLYPEMVLGPERRPIKVVYCTDTKSVSGLTDFIYGADLFICEGLYGEDEKREKAKEHFHSIFSEAAGYARDGMVRELWLTHYSPALTNPEIYMDETRKIFPAAKPGYDRMNKTLRFIDEL